MPPIPPLDGLRAAAILIVMASHAGLGKLVPGGFGVTIFFFLSGYLITSILRKEAEATGTVDLVHFYAKRSWRILPPLFITLTVVLAIMLSGATATPPSVEGVAADYLFLTNYLPELGGGRSLPLPLWSLDVEEHYYILFSTLFYFVLSRIPPARGFKICAWLCVAFLAIRCGIAWATDDLARIYYWSHTRMDSILFGSCLALWNNPVADRGAWRPTIWHFAAALCVLGLCFAIRSPMFRETFRYTLQGLALFVVFSYAIQTRGLVNRLLSSGALRWVALLSYTLYLAHMPAMLIAEQQHLPFPVITGLALSVLYAAGMYVLVERPIAAWRKRPRTPGRAAATAS